MTFSLTQLEQIIQSRAHSTSEVSYTRTLIEKGVKKSAEKFGEEAIEAVIAAVGDDKQAVIAEAGDVLFHLLVVLHLRGVSLDDVMHELETRTGQSGHAEKAARSSQHLP